MFVLCRKLCCHRAVQGHVAGMPICTRWLEYRYARNLCWSLCHIAHKLPKVSALVLFDTDFTPENFEHVQAEAADAWVGDSTLIPQIDIMIPVNAHCPYTVRMVEESIPYLARYVMGLRVIWIVSQFKFELSHWCVPHF